MADFALFFPKLMGHEGGYVWDARDPGGETYAGVARAFNATWPGWALVDVAKHELKLPTHPPPSNYPALNKALALEPLMKGLLTSFYKKQYWDALQLDKVNNQLLAEQLADHGASAGTGRPPKMIQFVANQVAGVLLLALDGKIGPKTLSAINTLDQTKLLKAFVQLRRDFYEYRAAARTPAPSVVQLFQELNLSPNATQRVFLNSWLARLPKV